MPSFKPTDPKDFAQLLPENDYPFEVRKAEEGTGKQSGDPYLKLTLIVFNGDKETTVMDYLSFGEKSHKKLWSFCQSTQTEKAYHDGQITCQSVEGLSGRVHIGIQEQDGYEPKNAVAYYKRPKKEDKGPLPKMDTGILKKEEDNSDLPF